MKKKYSFPKLEKLIIFIAYVNYLYAQSSQVQLFWTLSKYMGAT